MSDTKALVDEYHNVHVTAKELGRGGQGVVFRTNDPNIAIKLVLRNEALVTDQESLESFADKLKELRTLPFPSELQIASPAAVLQGAAGYAMKLMDEMLPFKHFWLDLGRSSEIGPEAVPSWLSGVDKQLAARLIHYQTTGGLRRRLVALSKCASILARLHAAGLLYGDLSPANAFVSRELTFSQVWLIDADNVGFDTEDSTKSFYTPKYGAPEILQGICGSQFRTDCHSFSTMAFYILTLVHPFIGNLVEAASDWDNDGGDDDIENRALAGHLPWVDDIHDSSNSTTNGLPRELVLSDELRGLFQESFGPGRKAFWRRPTIFSWPQALARASDRTILCQECGMTYFAEAPTCPYCNSPRPSILKFESFAWPVTETTPCWTIYRELPSEEDEFQIPHRLFAPFSYLDADATVLTLTTKSDGFQLRTDDMNELKLFVALARDDAGAFQQLSRYHLKRSDFETGFCLFAEGRSPRLVICRIQ
jgi:hypothetical protein